MTLHGVVFPGMMHGVVFRSMVQGVVFPGMALPKLATVRARIARRRNRLYVESERLRSKLFSGGPKKILFSGKPDWTEDIKRGFEQLPYQVEFGPISDDSFEQFDIVVPLSLSAMEEARQHSRQRRIALPMPAAESVHLCDDKYEFNRALIAAGFGQYIPEMGLALTPPYILKKRIGEWGSECYIIRNSGDEEAQHDRIADPNYFCQEFISGTTEFATHILMVDGKIVKALNIKYKFSSGTPIKGQDAAHFKVIHHCPYLDLFARILRTIQYEGLCCVNYKVAKGQLFLLEINPRFGGSLAPYFFSFVRHLR